MGHSSRRSERHGRWRDRHQRPPTAQYALSVRDVALPFIVGSRPGASGIRTMTPIDKRGRTNVRAVRQRLVLCRLMIDIMRNLHGAYAPASEPFGGRLETFFIGLCIALGHFEQKPFSITKVAAYMRVPRTTVMRRLERLQSWGLVRRQGRRYYVDDGALNSVLGLRSYQHIRRLLDKAGDELTVLDTLPD
jgi:hypothetical protein